MAQTGSEAYQKARAAPADSGGRGGWWPSRDVLRVAALVAGVYVALKLLWFAYPVFFLAFLGILFGLALSAAVDRLARWRIPRGLGAAGIVLAMIGLVVGLGIWVAPTLREQSRELRTRLPEAVDRVESWINERQSGVVGLILGGNPLPGKPDSAATAATAAAPNGAQADSSAQTAPAGRAPAPAARDESVSGQLGGAAKYFFAFLSSTLTVLASLLLVVITAVYIAVDPDLYRRGLMHLVPHGSRARTGEVLDKMALTLRHWLVTELIAMLVIGGVTTIVLLLLGVRAAIALGIIAGLLEFVPYVGPIAAAVPAIGMGLLDSPQTALYVAIAATAIQQFENHLLIPLLMEEGVDLPPVLTIVAQALMGLVFGFIGLLVAVPLLAAVLIPIKMLYVEGVVGDEVALPGEAEAGG